MALWEGAASSPSASELFFYLTYFPNLRTRSDAMGRKRLGRRGWLPGYGDGVDGPWGALFFATSFASSEFQRLAIEVINDDPRRFLAPCLYLRRIVRAASPLQTDPSKLDAVDRHVAVDFVGARI